MCGFSAGALHRADFAALWENRAAKPKGLGFGQPGENDPTPNEINLVHLDACDHLVKEWFLVMQHPAYSRALVAHELSKTGTPHAKRTFRGILTSDQGQVEQFARVLRERVKTLPVT